VRGHPLLTDPFQHITATYFTKLDNLRWRSQEENSRAAAVTYTPLHGLGAAPVKRAFSQFGLPAPHVVPQQEAPDPDFPTVAFPNPEEGKGTWRLAFEEGGWCVTVHGVHLCCLVEPRDAPGSSRLKCVGCTVRKSTCAPGLLQV